jgi:hypothetical protein
MAISSALYPFLHIIVRTEPTNYVSIICSHVFDLKYGKLYSYVFHVRYFRLSDWVGAQD